MKKVLVINDGADLGSSYGRPFADFGKITGDMSLIEKDPESILCAVFTGGSDINPSLYGHKNLNSWINESRDIFEKKCFDKLSALKIPLFGICRGSQFLCAMAGGKIVQHLDNHGGYHEVRVLKNDRRVKVNSTHHQMQVPPVDAEVIAVCDPRRSERYVFDEPDFTPEYEYEIVYYPNIKALSAQYHPESMPKDSEGWKYYQELIEEYISR
mgnify:CR=1 FL=1